MIIYTSRSLPVEYDPGILSLMCWIDSDALRLRRAFDVLDLRRRANDEQAAR